MKRIDRAGLDALLSLLQHKGYVTVGPTVRSNAIVLERITSTADLPCGWTDRQTGGTYRLERRDDDALFSYVVGPQSWKKYLFPPHLRLWTAERGKKGLQVREAESPAASGHPSRLALIGMRACDLAAMEIQDKVFLQGAYLDPHYREQREHLFLVAVNCTQPGGTCFCASMHTGPRATHGFDLVLTEILSVDNHVFLIEAGSERGAKILDQLKTDEATKRDISVADEALRMAETSMGRTLETAGLKELLAANVDHPRWDATGQRCLTCGNCTQVCPTCFCSTVEDTTSLDGASAERWRRWDSCFTVDFSYIHGGSIRTSAKARYRQWMTHKLSNWIDQFGMSGCVGCGRCITWCPVGIDITEEAQAIRDQQPKSTAIVEPS